MGRRIDCGHEDGLGLPLSIGNPIKGPGAQRRPLTALQQQLAQPFLRGCTCRIEIQAPVLSVMENADLTEPAARTELDALDLA